MRRRRCLLAGHPLVRLRAVTITPGNRTQVGLVRHTLRLLDLPHLKIGIHLCSHTARAVCAVRLLMRKWRAPGSKDPTHAKNAVSGFHNKALGMDVLPQDDPDGTPPPPQCGWYITSPDRALRCVM